MLLNQADLEVSVVICTRNRGARIIQAAESVLKNTYPLFELLILDQSNNSETELALKSLRADPRLRYIHSSTKGLGLARRLSLELVNSDIVLMTDDDCEVEPDWVEQMAASICRHPQTAIVFCDVFPGPHDRSRGFIPVTTASRDALITNLWEWCEAGAANVGIGAGIGLRKSMVQAIGGFDPRLGCGTALHCAEETDIALRALLHGYHIYRTTATSTVHHGFRTFKEGRQLMRGYMYGIAAMYAKLLRCGHAQLVAVILFEIWRTVILPAIHNLTDLRIPPVLGRIVNLIKGFYAGWMFPINRDSEVFQPPHSLETSIEASRNHCATRECDIPTTVTPAIAIRSAEITVLRDATRITFTLQTPDGAFDLFYQIKGSAVIADTTAAVAAALLPAMHQGWAITTEAPISARVLAALPAIQQIIHGWDHSYTQIAVHSDTLECYDGISKTRGKAVFFSGGLDSFYTLLKNRDRIDTLIFVQGFDVALDDQFLRTKVMTMLRKAAAQLNLPLIEVETNLRHFADHYAPWDLSHGAGLASVALLLAAQFHTLYIPASDAYADLVPCGSHPLLDPLWSTEALQIIHDGCEANRTQKAAVIAQNDVALHTLRVCWKNPAGTYNCGRCEKCLRTMVNLYAVGALDRCTTFDVPLDPRRIARLRLGSDSRIIAYWKENLAVLQRRGVNPGLEKAIREAIKRPGLLRRLFYAARTTWMAFLRHG